MPTFFVRLVILAVVVVGFGGEQIRERRNWVCGLLTLAPYSVMLSEPRLGVHGPSKPKAGTQKERCTLSTPAQPSSRSAEVLVYTDTIYGDLAFNRNATNAAS
jgi:hypothetical protein